MRWPFCVYRENYRLFFGFTAALTTGREWSYSCRMASVMWPPHALSPAVGDASMFQAVKREAALPVDDPSDMARRINPCQALSSADLLRGGADSVTIRRRCSGLIGVGRRWAPIRSFLYA